MYKAHQVSSICEVIGGRASKIWSKFEVLWQTDKQKIQYVILMISIELFRNREYFGFFFLIIWGYKQTFTVETWHGITLINANYYTYTLVTHVTIVNGCAPWRYLTSKASIEGWERKRSRCFFTYIHLDLFRSHHLVCTPGLAGENRHLPSSRLYKNSIKNFWKISKMWLLSIHC